MNWLYGKIGVWLAISLAFLLLNSTAFAGENQGLSNISFHGYGELHYNLPKTGSSVPKDSDYNQMDFHRMVWGLSYRLNDRISLHTEVDFEHAAEEIELEFAYMDFLINEAINIRAGSMLMPVGSLNEFHEPPLFYSVERPYVETYIIPTTWMEGGAGIFGSLLPGLKYRLYLVSGLDASKFSDSTGIRGGRGKVGEAPAEDLAWVGRLEYVGFPGLKVGSSFYTGGANTIKDSDLDGAAVTIAEADVLYKVKGLELKGVYVTNRIDEADKISAKTTKVIGSEHEGWYAEGAYHIMRHIAPASDHDLAIFARWEEFNTQKDVESGSADPANDRQVATYGLAYYPHREVAVKVDFENWENEKGESGDRLNIGLAYMF